MSENVGDSGVDLKQIFKKPNAQRAINRIVSAFLEIGLTRLKIDFIRNIAFGWIEEYINGAVCPKCFAKLGNAREVPDNAFCLSCKSNVIPIKITPIRLYLALANDADIFNLLPERIKYESKSVVKIAIGKSFASTIINTYNNLPIDVIIEAVLSWLKSDRPDLYYTILLYPLAPEYIQILYEIEMDKISLKEMNKILETIGIDYKKIDDNKKKEVLIKVITEALEQVVDEYGVSTIGLKKFIRIVEDIKFKSAEILSNALS